MLGQIFPSDKFYKVQFLQHLPMRKHIVGREPLASRR